jgi:hypothetical protein
MVAPAMAPLDDDSVIASVEDLEQAIANSLRAAGCTYEELREQARTGAFRSAAARRSWVVVRGLVQILQSPTRGPEVCR